MAAENGKKASLSAGEIGLCGEEREEVEVVCSKHTEEWFCEVEQRAVCHVCEGPRHHNHTVVPLVNAVGNLKGKLMKLNYPLHYKRHSYNDMEKRYKEVAEHSKNQLVDTERQIKVEFEKLHHFLREEEEARLAALREEEEQKRKTVSREMKIIQDQISSLTASISALEQDMKKEGVSFLTSYKHSKHSTRADVTLPDQRLVSGTLIDVAKHLGNLSFRVWEKMKEVVKFTPVIMDPNTAHRVLSLSDDLSSMSTGTEQLFLTNPERNLMYPTVLGSEGFSSGRHSWEVEVGDHPEWSIGVVKESASRKAELLTREDGLWCILLSHGNYISGLHQELLPLKRRPQRIRVQLDCDKEELSFYDPEDMTHIYTYKPTFTEKVYPLFSIGEPGDAKHPDVKILQSELSVSVMSS